MNSAQSIIKQSGMSDRPEFYSGSGPDTYYLDSQRLAKIAIGIKTSLTNDPLENQKALKEFVKMVIAQKDMSPTVFLQSLYNLENNKRVFDKSVLRFTNNNDIGTDEEKRGSVAFALITLALSGRSRGTMQEVEKKSHDIKYNFLSQYCDIKPIRSSEDNWNTDRITGYTYTLKEQLFEVLS